ncbi:MAG: ATP-binding cassette domain-containing protein [Clostridiales bacterium]|jgi:D-methionine transport system ATP-binding protein|nr:ATP-binding cassette domain-containing protein [Clostridiales bacterium]
MVALENLSKTFNSKTSVVEAVKNVSLRVEQGEIHGIIGLSGAGKSTLVRCINLLERPTSGKVFLDGEEITAMSNRELRLTRRKIGMIFQQFNLFASRAVWRNIAYPLWRGGLTKKQMADRARELLALVDLSDKENVYPSQLSGGQKQRVAIARALANNPRLLLCDEATSALDPQTTSSILELLKKLNKRLGLTTIVITHEMHVVKEICDRASVMENGEIVESGEVFSLFANPQRRVTQDFIETASNFSKINSMIDENHVITRLRPGERILKFRYMEKSEAEALVSAVSRRFNIDVNVIFANLEWVGDAPLGGIISVVSGDSRNIDEALLYLRDKHVGVEVILDNTRVSETNYA